MTVLTAHLADPTGYGRVLRDDDDQVVGIVEQKDATEEQRAVREVNSRHLRVRRRDCCAPAWPGSTRTTPRASCT